MKTLMMATLAVVAVLVLRRTEIGWRLEDQAKALSDRVMLLFLQSTSNFEKEL